MDDSAYIRRLKERLRQDPGSRLMLSFAEEFRRRDKMEDAIAFLVDGTRKNPDYHAARLTLGRWYLSVEMLPEAKKEFLEVIEGAPQNIHARKGLAEIYKRAGNVDEAASEYYKVLEVNPSDSDAGSYLESAGYPLQNVKDGERAESSEAWKPTVGAQALGSAEGEGLELQGLQSAVPVGGRNDEIIGRLNSFLEAVKTGFSSLPVVDSGMGAKNKVIDRLDGFLQAIKAGFSPKTPDADGAVFRLNNFLDAIKFRFSRDLQKDARPF